MLTMHRELPHPAARVWATLTDPAELARWSPFVPDHPLAAPGLAGEDVPRVVGPKTAEYDWAGLLERYTAHLS